jgi:predicted negative regulator of RcsB-dependent stress response
MATPSNASEPETPDEEEEILPSGFDPVLFWDQYRNVIVLAVVAVILGGCGYGWYVYNQGRTNDAAEAALAASSNEDDFNQIIAKYPGTAAAGDAYLLLAEKLRDAKHYDDATQALQTFLDKYPNHPLIAAGDLGIAQTLDGQGKLDDAIARYQEVAAKYPDSYVAPVALLAQASILRHEGKNEDARRAYENFVTQFPDSVFAQEATAEMRMIRQTSTPATTGSNSLSTSLLDAIQKSTQQVQPQSVAPPANLPNPAPSAAGH